MAWTFFDCETTGPDPLADRLTQIAIVSEDVLLFDSLVNPGRPIPPAIQELTGITDACVAEAPVFQTIAPQLAQLLSAGPLVGFGCHAFDVPLLAEELARAGVAFQWPEVVDAGSLFKIFEPRDLTAALKFYCAIDHVGAHGALEDAKATRYVFLTQLAKYQKLHGLGTHDLAMASRYGREMADPAGKLTYIDGVLCFNTHRNKGVPVLDDVSYAEWICRNDFPLATIAMIMAELQKGRAGYTGRGIPVRAFTQRPEADEPF